MISRKERKQAIRITHISPTSSILLRVSGAVSTKGQNLFSPPDKRWRSVAQNISDTQYSYLKAS